LTFALGVREGEKKGPGNGSIEEKSLEEVQRGKNL